MDFVISRRGNFDGEGEVEIPWREEEDAARQGG